MNTPNLIEFLAALMQDSTKALKLQKKFEEDPKAVMVAFGLDPASIRAVMSRKRAQIVKVVDREIARFGGIHGPLW